MDDILGWVMFASFAGAAWSGVTFAVAYARKKEDQLEHLSLALAASGLLGMLMAFVAMLMASPEFDSVVPVVGGLLVGTVSGVFTAFGIMGGKTPG